MPGLDTDKKSINKHQQGQICWFNDLVPAMAALSFIHSFSHLCMLETIRLPPGHQINDSLRFYLVIYIYIYIS